MEKKYSGSSLRANIIHGIHPVEEALNSGRTIEKIFIAKDIRKAGFIDFLKKAREKYIPIQFVPVEKLNRLAGNNHQGVACIIALIQYYQTQDIIAQSYEKGQSPLLLLADRVTDVRNFGAIARTAYAAGVQGIIIPEAESAAINAEAMKSSAGALNNIPVCREKNLLTILKQLKLIGIQTIASDVKGSKYIFDCNLQIPTAIIVGSEGEGIAPELLRIADEIVKIPMANNFNSYNVSVATGMMLYEAMKQRMEH
ncbi:MAG: 23S rRNA (guanosine(2251)-2'-O)-methyltransferase RlmB [Chitinophagales bacterium]|nr:23S rRNA (guanosine(2251)-2'-O)-methyltransferase RlmB [Chitinophagales bacterium]